MLFTLTKKDCTVHAHLENLADLSFLLFVLYRVNHTSFMPAQNYHNVQSMVKSMFVSVLTGQHEGIDEYFPFLDSDDRIEVRYTSWSFQWNTPRASINHIDCGSN